MIMKIAIWELEYSQNIPWFPFTHKKFLWEKVSFEIFSIFQK